MVDWIMRTTVDIPDPLYRRLKARAASQGCSVKELVLRGVQSELADPSPKKHGHRVKLPLIESDRTDKINISSSEMDDLLFS